MFHRVDGDRKWFAPDRARQGDAGYDVRSPQDFQLGPGQVYTLGTNVSLDCPPGWFCLVSERSSQGKAGLTTLGNVVDEGYTGEIHVNLLNTSKGLVIVHQGDKVAQLVLVPRFVDPREHLLPARGGDGLGSTGVR